MALDQEDGGDPTLEDSLRIALSRADKLIFYALIMASIGTCAGYYVQSYCQQKGIDASGIEITLSARRDPHSKQTTVFVTTIHVPPDLPEKLHATLEKVAAQCAVKKTIMVPPEFVVKTVVRAD